MDGGRPPEEDSSQEIEEGLSSRYLIFKLGSERYACPLLQVREVVKVPPIKALPHKMSHLKGIANLKGQVLSVMDLRTRLGLQAPTSSAKDALMFIVVTHEIQLGLLVDGVESVVDLARENISNPLLIHPKISMKFFIGVGKLGDNLVHILDLESLVSEVVQGDSKTSVA